MKAFIEAIEYVLPDIVVGNEDMEKIFPGITAAKIKKKTGIVSRRVVPDHECASDLAVHAGEKLFQTGMIKPEEVDYILLCTESPDYFIPPSACLIQERLALPTRVGALDYNLGCSGYVYGLSLAKGLIETKQAKRVLLFTAETYSKYLNEGDHVGRTIFGDAGAVTLVSGKEFHEEKLGPFVFGTDGKGADNLIVKNGAMRHRHQTGTKDDWLFMDGPEIFNFTIETIPKSIRALLEKSLLQQNQVDYWIFHQANAFMLEHLRSILEISNEKFCINFADIGNTVSASIPIAIRRAWDSGYIKNGDVVALVGFGVGYSWGSCLARISLLK